MSSHSLVFLSCDADLTVLPHPPGPFTLIGPLGIGNKGNWHGSEAVNNKVLCLLSRSLISPASTHKTGQLVCKYCKISDLVQFLEENFKAEQPKISLFPWLSTHFRCYSGFQDTKLAYSHLQDFFLHEKKENACCCILIGLSISLCMFGVLRYL